MPHDRLRKFNIRDWFGQGIDWDGAMVVRCAEEIYVYISDRAYRIPVYRTIGRHLRGVHPVSTGVIVNGFARPEILFTLDVCVVPQRGTPHTRLRRYHSDDAKYGFERQKIGCDFCQVVIAGRRIYLRGQMGQTLDDSLADMGDAGTQAAQAM